MSLIHPEDRVIVDQHFQEHFTKNEALAMEFRIRTRAGEERWIDHVCQPVYGVEGQWMGRRASNRDATRRKRHEQLLGKLNQVSVAIANLRSPEEIFSIVGQELKKAGISSAIFLTDESQSRLLLKYLSFNPKVLRAAEKLAGLKAEEISISIEDVDAYKRVIKERETYFLESAEGVLRQILPEPVKGYAGKIVKILKVPRSIHSPLIIENEVIGLISVQSPDLKEGDVPTIAAFGHQLSAALYNVHLFEDTQQRLHELETLYELSSKLRQVETAEDLLPILLRELHNILDADSGAVTLLQPDGEHFRIALADGFLSPLTGRIFNIEEGISGHVFRTRQPYNTQNYAADPHRLTDMPTGNFTGPSAYAPMESETSLLGVLVLSRFGDPQARPFTPAEMSLLAAVGEMAGNALRRLGLFFEARKRLKRVEALRNVDMAITSSLDPRVTLRVLLDEVTAILEVDAATVLLLNPYTQTLEYSAGRGFHAESIEYTKLKLGEGYAGRAAKERRTVYVNDVTKGKEFTRASLLIEEGFVAYYGTPMIAKGRVLGVLETFHRKTLRTDGEWVEFLEALAGQAAIAIENSQLFYDLEQSNIDLRLAYDATIEGWSRAMDLRDEETEGHTQRVTELTLELARLVGINDEGLMHVRRGALLHDMGKLGVPDTILRKPGPLTDEEWEVMRQHPKLAYEMFFPVEYLRPALEIPYCHHEKWDGTGYPRGLKGEQIPLAARIFAVADVWDALNSDRPYRKAWKKEKVLAHIHQEAGSHFDPQIVEIFLAIMKEG